MKLKKNVIILLSCVLVVLFCVGCSSILEGMDDPQIRTYTEQMLEAIFDGDEAQAYTLVEDVVTEKDFSPVFTQLRQLLAQVRDHELKLISINRNTTYSDGQSVMIVRASYRMDTQSGVFVVDVMTQSGYQKLASFAVTPYEQTDHYHTGSLGHMEGAGIAQWVVLLSNIISYGLIVLAVVRCWRNKTKGRAGWIALCLLGAVSLGMTFGGSLVRFNFYLNGVFGYSAFLCYGGGTKVIRLLLPVGAVVSLLSRRKEQGSSGPADTPWVTEAPGPVAPVVPKDQPEEITEHPADQGSEEPDPSEKIEE